MDSILKNLLIIFIILVVFTFIMKENDPIYSFIQENLSTLNSLSVSSINKKSTIFPKRPKSLKYNLPVQRDKIEEVQKVEKDVLKYLGG